MSVLCFESKIKLRHIPVNIALKLFDAYVTLILLYEAEVWNVHERHNFESARSNFFLGGLAGSEDFACATLPTTLLDFQGKI